MNLKPAYQSINIHLISQVLEDTYLTKNTVFVILNYYLVKECQCLIHNLLPFNKSANDYFRETKIETNQFLVFSFISDR